MKYLAVFLEWSYCTVDNVVLLKTENWASKCSAKRVPTLYVTDHKQQSYLSLKLANHALFSSLLHNVSFHKRTVRASLWRMSISACVFLTGKWVIRPWYSASQ